jgi:hypothetical protein
MIFGNDVKMRLGLRHERNLDFLSVDEVSRTECSSASAEETSDPEQQEDGKKRECGGARHDLKIVDGARQACKGRVSKRRPG